MRRVRHARAAFDVVCGVHHHHHHHDRHHPHDSFVFVFFFSQAMVQGFAARLQAELRDADVPNADLSQVMRVVACCCACGMIVVVSRPLIVWFVPASNTHRSRSGRTEI